MTASSTLRAVLGLNFPAKNPVSKRLNQGSRRIVLFPNVISQPSVPNHVILTPAVPGPPLAGGVCAPSATPGSSNDLLQSTVAPATPAARPLPRNRRRETGGCHDVQPASTKHIDASSTKSGASLETAPRLGVRTVAVSLPTARLARALFRTEARHHLDQVLE